MTTDPNEIRTPHHTASLYSPRSRRIIRPRRSEVISLHRVRVGGRLISINDSVTVFIDKPHFNFYLSFDGEVIEIYRKRKKIEVIVKRILDEHSVYYRCYPRQLRL